MEDCVQASQLWHAVAAQIEKAAPAAAAKISGEQLHGFPMEFRWISDELLWIPMDLHAFLWLHMECLL